MPEIEPKAPSLTEENYRELAVARTAMKKIRRAVNKALFDAWFLAISSLVSLMFGYDSVSGWVVTIGLGIMTFVEFRAAAQLKRLEESSIWTLSVNQLAQGAFLGIYFYLQLRAETSGSGILQDPMVAAQLKGHEDVVGMVEQIVIAGYWALIAVTVAYCGWLALYFYYRGQTLRKYLQETPEWIAQMQRSGVSI